METPSLREIDQARNETNPQAASIIHPTASASAGLSNDFFVPTVDEEGNVPNYDAEQQLGLRGGTTQPSSRRFRDSARPAPALTEALRELKFALL